VPAGVRSLSGLRRAAAGSSALPGRRSAVACRRDPQLHDRRRPGAPRTRRGRAFRGPLGRACARGRRSGSRREAKTMMLRAHGQPRSWVALAAYTLFAAAFFGIPLLVQAKPAVFGGGADADIFIWAFAWWPHAILHGHEPFVTHAIWAPSGVNLAWTTTVPGLALAFSPLTLVA